MLDNLGFGEIAMLALMALLFFGPERLPQIGARIGRWIATLTQSSKAFMNEWREEALVVYDAVEEVRGIRDEIAAARAEIAGTVTTARDDVNDALSGARADVQAQVRGATTFSPSPDELDSSSRLQHTEESIPTAASSGSASLTPNPDRAIERTNKILAGLREKRRETEPTAVPSLTLSLLRETITALESDVQALREELARTRATMSLRHDAKPRVGPAPAILEADPVPHPQPVQAGELP